MIVGDVVRWFGDPANWSGMDGIPNRLYEHVQLSGFAIAAAAAIAIPLGVWLGHRGRGGFAAAAALNVGRAIPSFAILALALPLSINLGLGLGFWPTWLALFVLAMPPMFTNSLTGLQTVDPAVRDAARGIGMREGAILRSVELPLAMPLVVTGVRTAAVQVVATAPLGALVAWGGLGRFIVDGLATRDYAEVVGGAVLVAGLAIATDATLGAVERLARPGRARRRRAATEPVPVMDAMSASR